MTAFIKFLFAKGISKTTYVLMLLALLIPIGISYIPVDLVITFIPGFFLMIPLMVGLVSIPSKIVDMKTTSMIKRVGQIGITKTNFLLSYFIVYGTFMLIAFLINFLFFYVLIIPNITSVFTLSDIDWISFIVGYLFLCILVISTGIILPVIFGYSKTLTTIFSTLFFIFILLLSNGIINWNVLTWDLLGPAANPPTWLTGLQYMLPWAYISTCFNNAPYLIYGTMDIWYAALSCGLLIVAFTFIFYSTFKFEKIR